MSSQVNLWTSGEWRVVRILGGRELDRWQWSGVNATVNANRLLLTSAPDDLLEILRRRRGKSVLVLLEKITVEFVHGIGHGSTYMPGYVGYVTEQADFYGHMENATPTFVGGLSLGLLHISIINLEPPTLWGQSWRVFRIWWELWLDRQESGLGAEYV